MAATASNPPSAATVPGGAVGHRKRQRLSLRDWLFAAALVLYGGYSVAVLIGGVLAAIAVPTGLHDALHVMGFQRTLVGRTAEAIADAAHTTQPALQLALDYAFSVFNLVIAGVLLWLRPRDVTARLLAIGMVGTAAIFNLQAYSVYEALEPSTLDQLSHGLFHLVAAVSYAFALLLFPEGRLVPRWRPFGLVLLYLPVAMTLAVLAFRIRYTSPTLVVVVIFGLVTPAVGVAAQAYRYRHSPTPVQRQQGRLLFWALAPALLLAGFALVVGFTDSTLQELEGRGLSVIPVGLFRLFQPIFAIIPLAVVVGLLRFRLWNVDRLLTRTIAYGALAGFVSLVYIVVVVALGQVVGTRSDNVILSIIATGVVAFAFQPARSRIEHFANRLVYGRRATPYEALSEFSKGMAETVATEEKLSRLAQVLAEGTAASRAAVWLAVGDELRRAAEWPEDYTSGGADAVPLTTGGLPQLGVAAAVPVLHEGELLGALSIDKPANESLAPTEEKLLADLAAQAGLVLRNVRLTAELLQRLEELRASRHRLLAAQDEARRRLERNLHDGAQQELVSLKVRLGLAQKMAEQGKPVAELLHQLTHDTGEAIDNLRDLARGIYPPLLAAEGLPAALRAQARKTPVSVDVVTDAVGRYPQEIEAAVYFCCLEALQNIAKYAGATEAVITLAEANGALAFSIADDGQGFDPAAVPPGSGLQNMADRIDALDGHLTINSSPGSGVVISGDVPLPVDQVGTASAAEVS